jgi:CRISPR-associated protein Csx10
MFLGAEVQDLGGNWRVLALDLDLRSPIVVPAETLGNMVTTQDHIPGSLLLPALHGWLHQLFGADTTQAIASGAVQVRNAYPAVNGRRLFPVPASLFKLKEGNECTNYLRSEPTDNQQRKQLRVGFVSVDALPLNATGGVLGVETSAITHATIEDEKQRPTEKVGGVFTYQAIRPGQRLMAELWIDGTLLESSVDFSGWLEKAPKSLRIGRAKKDDYGQVDLTCREITLEKPTAASDELTVWLTSPTLLRDKALAPVMSVEGLCDALRELLGVGLEVRTSNEQPCAFLRPWRDDGWNNAWQMRRATRFGIAPGSCVTFKVDGSLTEDLLARIQARGIGERRGEGYGELLFNPPLLSGLEVQRKEIIVDRPEQKAAGTLKKTDFTLALQRRTARLAIRRKALAVDERFRSEMGWRSGNSPLPPNTQLGALRSLMESLKDKTGLQRISAWLNAVQNNEKRRDKWPLATQERLAFHLDTEDPRRIWETLGLNLKPLPEHDPAALQDEMYIEAIKSLWLTAISRQLNENNRQPGDRQSGKEANHGA